jgi:hypothetical protein
MEGASAQTIEKSRAAAPDELPASYLQLLSATDGGEGPLPVNPFNLCLDPAHEVIARVSNGNYRQSEFDEFLIFGGNGGGEYIALDMRQGAPWPVVTLDMAAGAASQDCSYRLRPVRGPHRRGANRRVRFGSEADIGNLARKTK